MVFGVAVASTPVLAFMSERAPAKSRCPSDINGPDVYHPITGSNGITYPDACYAYRDCATGCAYV